MNYIGSKLKLSSWIKDEITKKVGTLSDKVFADIFAGTGIIGRTFKKDVKQIISNDLEYYSFILNKNYIENSQKMADSQKYIDELNSLPLIQDGFIYQNYCSGSGSERLYFSDENGQKIDTIRSKIEELFKNKKIDQNIYYFLLSSLLESADKVANTASVYGAFLKKIKKTASQKLVLEPANFEVTQNQKNLVFNEDANSLIKKISGDILYLDPPYNSRQYGANYHLLNTIAEYKTFQPKGKTGLRNYNKSKYSQTKEVLNSFEDLIKNAEFKYIFLSYNNEGLMSSDEVRQIMSKYGKYDLVTKKYQRFKADKNRTQKAKFTFEHLHILLKQIID
jgi:adenine-specific DNA-methyltransferase